MTNPLVALLNRYDAELQEIELLPPAVIELPAFQTLALIKLVQIGAAAPGVVENNSLLSSAIAAAKHIQESFNPESAIYEVLEHRWQKLDKSCVASHKTFTGIEKRQQRLIRPEPYYPDDHHHF
jgi:hypothetical protein